jgi:nucleoside-diphosphate-sugar epimerase
MMNSMISKPNRILVTGGAGFLGLHLVPRLLAQGWAVRILDLAPPGAGMDLEAIRADVRMPGALAAALDGVQAVVHAAFASPRLPTAEIRSTNVEGTRRLCEAALARGVERLVVVSSAIVTQPPRPHPFWPESPLGRLETYRVSRIAAEAVAEAAEARGLSVAVARPAALLGPGRVRAFALLLEAVRRGGVVPLLGRGDNRYQLLDIRDLADALCRLAGCRERGVFPLGASPVGMAREDLVRLIRHAGTGARLRPVPGLVARAGLRALELGGAPPPSDWHRSTALGRNVVQDVERAREVLGWHPRDNAEALCQAYDWYAAEGWRGSPSPPPPAAHRALLRLASRLLAWR